MFQDLEDNQNIFMILMTIPWLCQPVSAFILDNCDLANRFRGKPHSREVLQRQFGSLQGDFCLDPEGPEGAP